MDNKYKAVELSDEQMAMVVGGKENESQNGIYSSYCNKYITLDGGGSCRDYDNCNNYDCSYHGGVHIGYPGSKLDDSK